MVFPQYPIVVLSFYNCELHCCHLDGYKTNTAAFLGRLAAVETQLLARPAHSTLRLWCNLDDTKLDAALIQIVVQSLLRTKQHIFKIAFVGLRGLGQRRFEHTLKKSLEGTALPRSYFTDAEQAKEWLV